MALLAVSKGTRVWVRTGSGASNGSGGSWAAGTVVSVGNATCGVALDSSVGEGTGAIVEVSLSDLEHANPTLLDGVSDLTHLSYLNEPGILHVLDQRYAADTVYTTAGPVLVAINPFKPLPLYGPDTARHYSQRSNMEVTDGYEPHVFLTADRAFKQMVVFNQCQSMLITGESGAGKTETTKIVMRYLAALAGGTGMEDRVLETNPILEAFGNAKTIHNNNSSRFGKLIEIYFNRSHSICGALIHTYLLEKSRVVHQQPGERSYHIFYQLCRGASEEERVRYLLPPSLDDFDYLSSGGCTRIAGVDDATQFVEVKAALTAVGISQEHQASLFSVLAAILWLGNVQFTELHDDAVTVDEPSLPAVRAAAALLGCGEPALVQALTTRRMLAGAEEITRKLNMEAALDNRDALSKAIYAALFKWLVEQINAALAVGKQRSETTLSILDIYGFECFKQNSFEQLCINFANERLQQQFSKHMFRLEQEVYEGEGIDWAHVEFVDNQDCVDLIEARPPAGVGILSLLDEECMMPKGSDATFAAKLQQRQAGHARFSSNPKCGGEFTVQHYAGPVAYNCAKFLDKNRDTLSKDLVALLQASSAPLVQVLAAEMERSQERKGSQTVGGRFRDQLRDLIQRLDTTSLHFVRCIKPNSQQVAGRFDPALILHQLRCCGVLEVARIARAGYPTRYRFQEFAERYCSLLPDSGGKGSGLPAGVPAVLKLCQRVLEHFAVDPSQYQIGRTRLFFRAGVLGQLEEAAARMQWSALYIQSMWRMARCRRVFVQARAAAVAIQAHWRGHQGRLAFAKLVRQHQAATRIQAAARGCAARRRHRRALTGVVSIQMAWRRHVVKQRVAARLAERRRLEAEQAALAAEQRRQQETFEAIQRDFAMDAGEIRRILGLWQEHGEAFTQWREQRSAWPGRTQSAAAEAAPLQAPAAEDSGLLLEIAAANVDAQEMQQRMEGLQGYCRKLESSVDDLREENQLLHRAMQSLQQQVAGKAGEPTGSMAQRLNSLSPRRNGVTPPGVPVLPLGLLGVGGGPAAGSAAAAAAAAAGRPPAHSHFAVVADGTAVVSGSARPSHDGSGRYTGGDGGGVEEDNDGDSISLMSLNDGDSFTTDSQCAGLTPTVTSLAAAREESAAVVGMLHREFDKKHALLDDDADFIREVRTGQAEAPGMNPELEMQRLLMRYKAWKKEFKERVVHTQRILKQLKREEKRVVGLPSAASMHSSRQHAGPASSSGHTPVARPTSNDGSHSSYTSRMLSHLNLHKARKG